MILGDVAIIVGSQMSYNGGFFTQQHGDGCLSGCTSGLVCYWELSTGNCLYEFDNRGTAVLKLDVVDGYFVGLFSDECIRTWDKQQGQLRYKIQLVLV